MNELYYRDPFMDMFKQIEALTDFNFDEASRGLKKLIRRPHDLITKKDKDGKIVSYDLRVVYTPFKKSDIKVSIVKNELLVKCGSENIEKDDELIYCGISKQSYEFSLPLADTIDTTKITAKAEDGILYISLPVKAEIPEELKTINIDIA